MSRLTQYLIFGSILVLSSPVYAKADFEEIRVAQQQVSEYRELRRACVGMALEKKYRCYNELNAMTEQYKKAKQFLAMHKSVADDMLSFAE